MQKGLVSIVVPIYNTEKYLDRCISSIVNQTYKNLEILLIDDGSPDNCPQMCDEWAKRDGRIRVIHKKNAGLGMARNTGIENATGEYICFFDSDDYVAEELIEKAYTHLKKECADVVLFGFSGVNPAEEETVTVIPTTQKSVYSQDEVQNVFLPDLLGRNTKTGEVTNLYMSACMCMISIELLTSTGWRFVSERDIISEDVFFLLGLYKYVKKAVIINEALYYYRENQVSVSHVYRADRYEKIKYFYNSCISLCKTCSYSAEVEQRCAEPYMAFTIAALKQEVAHFPNKQEALSRIKLIVDDAVLQQVLEQKKHDKTGLARKILLWAMRHKYYNLCYFLLTARNAADR